MHIYTIFVVLCYSQWPSVSECLRCVVHFLGLDFQGRPSVSRQAPWRPSGDSIRPRGSASGTGSVAAQTGGHAGNPPRIEAKSPISRDCARFEPEHHRKAIRIPPSTGTGYEIRWTMPNKAAWRRNALTGWRSWGFPSKKLWMASC